LWGYSEQSATKRDVFLRQLLRASQNPGDEAQPQIRERNLGIAGPSGEQLCQQTGEPVPVQKTRESEQSGSSADFSIGEADLDGFLAVVQLNKLALPISGGLYVSDLFRRG
jgi:hypothetical protein